MNVSLWTSRQSAVDNSWYGVTYGNGLFVAVSITGSGNRVMTSPDGITWTSRNSVADNAWWNVAYGNGLFVAISASGSGNRVMTSPDGITWTSRNSASDNNWFGITYGNGLFVAVAGSGVGNRVMTSLDGITWTSRNSASDNIWRSVAYGNGLFVAVSTSGTGNRVMTSPNGITWTSRNSPANNDWYGITYGNGLFVAVAGSGLGNRVMTSPDGLVWTLRTYPVENVWYSISYGTDSLGNGVFVAVAAAGSGSGNRVMSSSDGINWISGTSNNNDFRGVVYGNGLFVAVSATGTGNRVMTATTLVPTLGTLNTQSPKIYGSASYSLTNPTSNSSGNFIYTSSNELVATMSGNIVSIVGSGKTIITAIQSKTTNYTSGTTSSLLQVNKAIPNIGTLNTQSPKIYGSASYSLTNPSSNSDGIFSYISSNESVATVFGNIVSIVGSGKTTITAIQSETTNYTSGTTSSSLQVNESTPTNPVIAYNSYDLLYFMNTTSEYALIQNSLEIDYPLVSKKFKILTGKNVIIIKNG